MEVFAGIAEARAYLAAQRDGRRVVLVPTMGALHEGHRACMEVARGVDGALVVASIFVNPTQFGPSEDFDRYPRSLQDDLAKCARWGCDAAFTPDTAAMYPTPQRVWVTVEEISAPLCGRSRPGHFRGVTTVVAKLFSIVQPEAAVFGQKDAQQALVIREMVRQLDMPVEILLARTVREPDGLALSSRNAHLDRAARERAPGIWRALRAAADAIARGERRRPALEDALRDALAAGGIDRVEYAEVLCASDLSALDPIRGRVILAVAARLGATRLIDNIVVEVGGTGVDVDVPLF
jgi:pantoate--beta-alanine ligase